MNGKRTIALLATLGFLVAFASLAIIEGGKERKVASRQAYRGNFLVDKVGLCNGVVTIAMTPVDDATDGKHYDVAGGQQVALHVLQLATTALMNKAVVDAYVDPAENPYPTILHFFLTDKSVVAEGEANLEPDLPADGRAEDSDAEASEEAISTDSSATAVF